MRSELESYMPTIWKTSLQRMARIIEGFNLNWYVLIIYAVPYFSLDIIALVFGSCVGGESVATY